MLRTKSAYIYEVQLEMDDQALEWFSEKNKLHEFSMKSK